MRHGPHRLVLVSTVYLGPSASPRTSTDWDQTGLGSKSLFCCRPSCHVDPRLHSLEPLLPCLYNGDPGSARDPLSSEESVSWRVKVAEHHTRARCLQDTTAGGRAIVSTAMLTRVPACSRAGACPSLQKGAAQALFLF